MWCLACSCCRSVGRSILSYLFYTVFRSLIGRNWSFLCVNDTPADTYGSDPAGAGMARGLTFAISVLYGIITMIVFYLVVKLISVGLVLPLCVVLGIFSFSKLISNQKKKKTSMLLSGKGIECLKTDSNFKEEFARKDLSKMNENRYVSKTCI